MKFILDASAVLAVLHLEPGGSWVLERLSDSAIGAVNVIEVVTRLIDRGATPEDAWAAFTYLRLPVIDIAVDTARSAAELRVPTRAFGLSLADRACLALAIREGATAVTADRAWARVDAGCVVEVIR